MSSSRDIRSLDTEDLIRELKATRQAVEHWLRQGMPVNKAGDTVTHDLLISHYWVVGNQVNHVKPLADRVELSPSQKVAIGWLHGPADRQGSRYNDVRGYLLTTARAGISTEEALTSLHYSMGLFEAIKELVAENAAHGDKDETPGA